MDVPFSPENMSPLHLATTKVLNVSLGCASCVLLMQHLLKHVVELLVEAGFEVNEVDSYGCTALHRAAQRGNADAIGSN